MRFAWHASRLPTSRLTRNIRVRGAAGSRAPRRAALAVIQEEARHWRPPEVTRRRISIGYQQVPDLVESVSLKGVQWVDAEARMVAALHLPAGRRAVG